MADNNTDEQTEEVTAEQPVETSGDDTAVEAAGAETADAGTTEVEAAPAEDAPAAEEAVEAAPAEEAPAAKEAAPAAPAAPAKPRVVAPISSKGKKKAAADEHKDERVHKRAEKVGIVASDKMTKTVTVRVDRLVKHPIYRKYVKRRKKFMAHDDLGARIGDRVKIVETRPLSARKRWRVVEIIQRAEL